MDGLQENILCHGELADSEDGSAVAPGAVTFTTVGLQRIAVPVGEMEGGCWRRGERRWVRGQLEEGAVSGGTGDGDGERQRVGGAGTGANAGGREGSAGGCTTGAGTVGSGQCLGRVGGRVTTEPDDGPASGGGTDEAHVEEAHA